jgi:PAS domain S-box-containing protein
LIIGIGQEVTEHIKAQKRYENLVESAYDLIYELNKEGNFTFINKNSEIITGYALEELFQSNSVDSKSTKQLFTNSTLERRM